MNLREKLCEPFDGLNKTTVSELEKIVKDFTIGFVVWLDKNKKELRKKVLVEELLEIYKKEKGL